MNTTEACKRIRTALRERSGRAWSVTRGRGTAAWYITIASPAHTGLGFDNMLASDRWELSKLLGLARVHYQGVMISPDQQAEYVQRAETGKAGA